METGSVYVHLKRTCFRAFILYECLFEINCISWLMESTAAGACVYLV